MKTAHAAAFQRPNPPAVLPALRAQRFVQRQCSACGGHAAAGEECESCAKKKAPAGADAPAVMASRFGHDFSSVPVRGLGTVKISQTDDPLEREADRVAAQVVAAQPPQAISGARHGPAMLHREPTGALPAAAAPDVDDDDGDVDEEADAAVEVELTGDESGRPKLSAGAESSGARAPVSIPSGGRPLEAPTRNFMEQRFAHDFSAVRVHTDNAAAASAAQIQANAYTFGNDVVFAAGRYAPETSDGRRLLAHELTHVVQQQAGRGTSALHRDAQRDKKRRRRVDGPLKPSGRKRSSSEKKAKPKCGPKTCDGNCTGAVNTFVHHPNCGNETCPPGPAASSANFIRHLDVDLTTQMVVADMGDKTKTTSKIGPFLSSPNPSTTPVGMHTIGAKCGPCHTNNDAHGMAWFTGFVGLEFGFHNSQRVAAGTHSLGCVRVPCSRAQWIHDNTASGVTTVCVHKGGHCGRGAKKGADKGGAKKSDAGKKKANAHGGGSAPPPPAAKAPLPVSVNEPGDEIFADEFEDMA